MSPIIALILSSLVATVFAKSNCLQQQNGHHGNGNNGNNHIGNINGGMDLGNQLLWAMDRQDSQQQVANWGDVINTGPRFEYRQIGSIPESRRSIRFRVRTATDAHIGIHENPNDYNSRLTEVVIGVYENTQSVIRLGRAGRDVVSFDHAPLDAFEYRDFWIRWNAERGSIAVGEGSVVGEGRFLYFENGNLPRYRYISISGHLSPGSWQFERGVLGSANNGNGGANGEGSENGNNTPDGGENGNSASSRFGNTDWFFGASNRQGSSQPSWGSVINTPRQFGYRQIRSLASPDSIRFQVRARSNAHIALHQYWGVTNNSVTEIVLGQWGNRRSIIRQRRGGTPVTTVRHRPLNGNVYRTFWIRWDQDGRVSVGEGINVGERRFLFWRNPNPHPIRYLSISTGRGTNGRWRFERQGNEAVRVTTIGDLTYVPVPQLTDQLDQTFGFPFYVRAGSDARILLQSRENDEYFDVYDIRVGTESNKQSHIRRGRNGQIVDRARHRPLSGNHYLPFWVRCRNGVVDVGEGVNFGRRRFLHFDDRRPYEIRFASVGTGEGADGTWFFKATV